MSPNQTLPPLPSVPLDLVTDLVTVALYSPDIRAIGDIFGDGVQSCEHPVCGSLFGVGFVGGLFLTGTVQPTSR